jgi:hypothetical protein
VIVIHDFTDPSKVLFSGSYGVPAGSGSGSGLGNNHGNGNVGSGNGNGNFNGNTVINLGGDYNVGGFGGVGNESGNDNKGSGNGNGNGNGNNVFNFDYYKPSSTYQPKSLDSIYGSASSYIPAKAVEATKQAYSAPV